MGGRKEFGSQDALSSYLRAHPKADASKHSVVKGDAASSSSEPVGKHGPPKERSQADLKASLPVSKSGRQSFMGVDVKTISKVHEFSGATGLQANFGRKLRAHKVTSAGLDDYVTSVVTNYLVEREAGESFTTWVARADEALLRGDKTLVPALEGALS